MIEKQSGPISINVSVVKRLIAEQFPAWAGLPVRPVQHGGWDNRMFHLGEHMIVRLPSSPAYRWQVQKEQYWLPKLAPLLPLPVPVPLAMGSPAEIYPLPWSVYEWIEGESAERGHITDRCQFARNLADFLAALQQIDTTGGPVAGEHNFFRGGSLAVYNDEVSAALAVLRNSVDVRLAAEMWQAALAAPWNGPPRWFHGDISGGNLLVRNGRLNAVIDFGTSGVGDPACDLAITWTFFEGESRRAFRAAMQADNDTWARGKGWALWKALIVLARLSGTGKPAEIKKSSRVADDLLDEYKQLQ